MGFLDNAPGVIGYNRAVECCHREDTLKNQIMACGANIIEENRVDIPGEEWASQIVYQASDVQRFAYVICSNLDGGPPYEESIITTKRHGGEKLADLLGKLRKMHQFAEKRKSSAFNFF